MSKSIINPINTDTTFFVQFLITQTSLIFWSGQTACLSRLTCWDNTPVELVPLIGNQAQNASLSFAPEMVAQKQTEENKRKGAQGKYGTPCQLSTLFIRSPFQSWEASPFPVTPFRPVSVGIHL